MKSKTLRKTLLTILEGVFLCIVLASCDNFMSGGDTRNQLEERIAYNNAPSSKLIIKAQSEPNQPSVGEFLSDGEKICKLGYTIDVQFNLNKQYYIYLGMKAVGKTSDAVDHSQNVEFTDISSQSEKEDGIYKVRIKLLKTSDDIKIIPVCILQPRPALQSHTPSNSKEEQYANVPVTLNFSIPMADTIADKINISLYGTELSEYFQKPELSADKKTLTIRPKKDELMEFINLAKVPYYDILFSLDEDIIVTTQYGNFPFDYTNSSFTVRYIGQQEHKAPDRHDFFITPQTITLQNNIISGSEKFTEGQLDFENDDYESQAFINKVLANTCAGELYIYGKFLDTETGVSTVKVQEDFIMDEMGEWYQEEVKTVTYTSQSPDAEFVSDKNGITNFCIKHKLGYDEYIDEEDFLVEAWTPNGAYSLSISVADAAENLSQSIEYSVFVVNPENAVEFPYLTNTYIDYSGKTAQEYHEALKNVRIYYDEIFEKDYDDNDVLIHEVLPSRIFCSILMPPQDITLFCEYKDKTGSLVRQKLALKATNPLERYWELPLNVESLAGLNVTVYAYFNGCLYEKSEQAFPGLYDFTVPDIIEHYGQNVEDPYDEVDVSFKTFDGTYDIFAIGLDKETKKFVEKQTYGQGDVRVSVDKDWYFILQFYDLYGEMFDYALLKDEFENTDLPQPGIISHSYEYIGLDDDNNARINITITIAPDSWEKFDDIKIEMSPYDVDYNNYLTRGNYTFTYENSCLTWTDVTFTLTGIKGIKSSSWGYYEIPQIENANVTYDYIAPGLGVVRTDFENYTMTLDDGDGSGCKHGLVKIGQNEYELTQDNNFTCTVPALVIYENSKILNGTYTTPRRGTFVYYESEDNNGNTGSSSKKIEFVADPVSLLKDSISYTPGSGNLSIAIGKDKSIKYSNSTYKNLKINIDKYNNPGWINSQSNISLNEDYVEPLNHYNSHYEYYAYVYDIPTDSFIKITAGYQAPLYYYLGTKNSGSYDYIMKNGNSSSSVIISSDAPVFIHTMVTSVPYSDCKDWTPNAWEVFGAEKNIQVYDFTPTQTQINMENEEGEIETLQTITINKQPQTYTIPGDLKPGQSYCVIAHFADGHLEMSEVMQK